jgi:hypothetical protein
VDRMAAEAPSWAAEAAVGCTVVAAATAWDPEPTRSMAVVTSIDMTIGGRIGTAIIGPIPILHTVALAGGGRQTEDASGCAATGGRPTDIGTTTIARTTVMATIARMADIGTAAAIFIRPMDVAKPVTERKRQMRSAPQSALRHSVPGSPYIV